MRPGRSVSVVPRADIGLGQTVRPFASDRKGTQPQSLIFEDGYTTGHECLFDPVEVREQ